jgi:hypothetical protein
MSHNDLLDIPENKKVSNDWTWLHSYLFTKSVTGNLQEKHGDTRLLTASFLPAYWTWNDLPDLSPV